MKLLSIIAEYNPFHNGHRHHLLKSWEKIQPTHTMAIMSGHFLQRGEPALVDKWSRARIAVQNGVDLVAELPFIYSCQSAEIFAYGAISTLQSLNTVYALSFGCETPDLGQIKSIARLLSDEPEAYRAQLKIHLDAGQSYPKARQNAVEACLPGVGGILSHPNNILAVEYLKWLYAFKSTIKPVSIERIHTGYHESGQVNNFAGATHIRNEIHKSGTAKSIENLVPTETFKALSRYEEAHPYAFLDDYYLLVMGDLLSTSKASLRDTFGVSEGLENRILRASLHAKTMGQLLEQIQTKRYTQTRIKRILINHLMDHTEEKLYKTFKNSDYKPYLRVLAFNDKGKEILKECMDKSETPIVTNLSKDYYTLDPLQRYAMDKDVLSTNYYDLVADKGRFNEDFRRKPEIL